MRTPEERFKAFLEQETELSIDRDESTEEWFETLKRLREILDENIAVAKEDVG